MISSIRDGLNLVSYEYLACQEAKKGVILMSTYAGAMKTLPTSSLIVLNPWDTPRFAEKINQALNLGDEEKEQRYKEVMKVVNSWTRSVLTVPGACLSASGHFGLWSHANVCSNSVKWGKVFLETLMKGDVPENPEMPDSDPLDVWRSDIPDSETGHIQP